MEHDALSSRIVFYFDFISPYAYVGSVAIERLAQRLGRTVEWRPVLIGVTILKIMGMPPLRSLPLKGPYLRRDLERLSDWFEVPVRLHDLKGVDSLASCRAFQELSRLDPAMGKQFARAVFDRLWVRGQNITLIDDVLHVASEIGGDTVWLADYLDSDLSKARLRVAVDDAVRSGVFGVPTFVADGEMFWGNDHLWMLEQWLTKHSFKP